MDITQILEALKLPYDNMSLRKERVFKIDVSQMTELKTVGTHQLISIPKSMVVDSVRVLVADSVTAGTSATVKFSVGSVDLLTATAVTALSQGTLLNLDPNQKKVVDFEADYALTMTVATAALTAGAFFIVVSGFDLTTVTERG